MPVRASFPSHRCDVSSRRTWAVLGAVAFALVAGIVPAPRASAATSPEVACLQHAQSTADMDNCVGTAYAKAKKRLDAAYAKLLAGKGLAPGNRKALVQAQQRWIRFRDADCGYAESLAKGGTLSAVTKGLCLVRDTSDRADALQDYLSTS